jgi:hypothetical protein
MDGYSSTRLSDRAKNALCAHGINSLVDVVEWTESALLRLDGVGRKTVDALRDELAERRLKFADAAQDDHISLFASRLSEMVADRARFLQKLAFKTCIESQLRRIAKGGVDLTRVSFDDLSDDDNVIMLMSGKEVCRFSVSVRVKMVRAAR